MTRRYRVFIVGTRAQLIKIAPVVVACEKLGLPNVLLMTGQHQETMQDLVVEFGIASPQIFAMVSAEHATVRSLLRWVPEAYRGIRRRLCEVRETVALPLDVLVHGDTLSTLLGALAARRDRSRLIHLESGLTSGRLFDPFPEELCRRLVFRLANVAMCPNALAAEQMRHRRGVEVIDTAGNSIIDAVALTGALEVRRNIANPYLVASLHRFGNLYDARRLRELVVLIEAVALEYPVHFVLHPATRNRLQREQLLPRLAAASGVVLLPRMGYRDFLCLAAGAACVLTDGGSNQEELAVLGVPTIIMRTNTERPDGVGSNAIMESAVPGGVVQFIRERAFVHLRQPPMAMTAQGPASRIAQFLATSGNHGN